MEECKMRHVKLTRQMNGMITIIFQKVTLFLFLKDRMRLCKGRRVTVTSRILHSSMSSNRIHSTVPGREMNQSTVDSISALYEWRIRDDKLTNKQWMGRFKNATFVLQGYVRLPSRILHLSMSSNRIHNKKGPKTKTGPRPSYYTTGSLCAILHLFAILRQYQELALQIL